MEGDYPKPQAALRHVPPKSYPSVFLNLSILGLPYHLLAELDRDALTVWLSQPLLEILCLLHT
jgi:hypothetical protein